MANLNSAQKEAVEYLSGPLLVLAGPGTGKTQLLSAKVEYILKNTDTNPENILCLTFTEAGASNMRSRLLSMVGPGASSVNIHTYHAFGSDLLAQYKNYATEFSRNLDAPIDTVTQYKIIKNIQDALPAMDIMKTANVSDIIDAIASAKSARLSASDLSKIASYNEKSSTGLNEKASLILKKLVPRMKFDKALEEVYQPLLEALAEFTSPDPIVKNIEPEANFLVRELNDLLEAERGKEKPSVSPLTKWKNANFELDDAGNYRLKNVVANKKLASLANIMKKYDDELRKDGLFDFADMIEEATRVLKEDTGFRLTLSERYQYILLDEFQDTNPSQFELIRLLTDYENPIIMAVGDDDQAIFAFQGANASNLLDFQRAYNAKIVTLTENYRSTQEILDSSYKVAQKIADSFAKNHNIEKRLRANRISKTKIARHEFLSSDLEYHWVAEKIHDLISRGEPQSEIAIITPKHKYIAPLLPYLKAYPEINVAYEKRENILDDPKIRELATLSRFIQETADGKNATYRLLEIFSFPYWEIPPVTAISALSSRPSLEDLANSENENLSAAATFLAELVAKSFETPLEQLLDKILNYKFLAYYTKDSYSEFKLYENLSVLREAIKSHTKEQNPKLKDFINFLDDYEAAGEAILNTSPYQDGTNSVQIMTAHKSKGLEFKHVFLVATDNLSWGKSKGNNNLLTLPKNLIQIRHTGITDDERLRLFFVAITRAKETLTITNSIKDYSGKTPARLEYLEEHDSEDGPVSPLLPNQKIIVHDKDIPDDLKIDSLEKQWLATYEVLTPDLEPLLKKRVENLRLSATDLTSFIDIIYSGPMEFYRRRILKAPPDPATEQIIFGNLIHATFEAVTNQNLDELQALAFYEQELETTPVSDAEKAILLEKGKASLPISLKTFHDILHHPGARAEVNLASEHLMLDKIPLTGKIDHLNIDENEKTIEIYDFKTGNYHPEKWDAHPTLYKYKLQLEFYKLLLNLSPTYRKYEVKIGHILFVTPDRLDGKVYDKPYDYSEKSATELKTLIKSLYAHIEALDFLSETSPLNLYPDKSRTLRDIKNFIAML